MSSPALEQKYYEMLTRNDHPVFRKIFEDVTTFDLNTPFNSVLNLLVAKRMCDMRDAMDEVIANKHVTTVLESGIDRWELTLFGFTKTSVEFAQRKAELIARFNEVVLMALPDVIKLAEQITGVTPVVIRNMFFDGWTLDTDKSVLDTTSILSGDDQSSDGFLYVVIFNEPIPSNLLTLLDNELTIIEKGGSRHIIIAPPNFWVLDVSALDLDTILG